MAAVRRNRQADAAFFWAAGALVAGASSLQLWL
jgi:hypothetical protein